MRIHTNHLSYDDIEAAARLAGVSLERATKHGSRSRSRAFDVLLSGSGRTGGRWGNTGTHGASSVKAATWDEYGIFLAELFRRDDSVTIPRVYADREAFHWATGHRYNGLRREDIHANHRWTFDGHDAAHSYSVQSCKCGAVRRWRTHSVYAGKAPSMQSES